MCVFFANYLLVFLCNFLIMATPQYNIIDGEIEDLVDRLDLGPV